MKSQGYSGGWPGRIELVTVIEAGTYSIPGDYWTHSLIVMTEKTFYFWIE